MTDEYTRAQERILSVLKPRYVPARPQPVVTGKPGGRAPRQTYQLHAQIRALAAKGLRQFEIARELGVSRPTVGKHMRGKIKTC